jgi:hypothetical protein
MSIRPKLFYKDTARTMATTLERYPGTEYPKMFSPAQKNKHDRRAEHKRTKL